MTNSIDKEMRERVKQNAEAIAAYASGELIDVKYPSEEWREFTGTVSNVMFQHDIQSLMEHIHEGKQFRPKAAEAISASPPDLLEAANDTIAYLKMKLESAEEQHKRMQIRLFSEREEQQHQIQRAKKAEERVRELEHSLQNLTSPPAPKIDEETQRALDHYRNGGKIESLTGAGWLSIAHNQNVYEDAKRGRKFRIKRSMSDADGSPAPVSRDWNRPEDVPGDYNCYLRTKGGIGWALIIKADRRGVTVIADDNRPRLVEWDELKEMEHSTDPKTWKPCQVEEEAK